MLDFNKIVQQIEKIDPESLMDAQSQKDTLDQAVSAYDSAAADPRATSELLDRNRDWVLWPVVTPLEPFNASPPVFACDEPLTVIGVDGSQIMPSHHEVHSCYLLNIGLAVISYHAPHPPILQSAPRLYHRPEDLYPLMDRRRMHIDELYVSLERSLLELEFLRDASLSAKERGLPVVAMYDGSLIFWSVEKLNDTYKESYLQRMAAVYSAFEQEKIPLIGYLSHSRGADVINALRVSLCPYDVSHCRQHCGALNEEDFPCSTIWPLTDRQLMAETLSMHHRSPVFLSGSSVSQSLPRQSWICFLYANVGYEICRIEFPRYVFSDSSLMDLALGAVVSQTQKGMGYPVCLAEAHHQAVIKGADRDRFFSLMTEHLVGLGVEKVHISPKAARKRFSFI